MIAGCRCTQVCIRVGRFYVAAKYCSLPFNVIIASSPLSRIACVFGAVASVQLTYNDLPGRRSSGVEFRRHPSSIAAKA